MHELSITESVLEIAIRHARKANAKHITHLYLVIGQLASIVDESVQFYWDIISKGTMAEGSVLHFRKQPATLACLDCHSEYTPGKESFSCPNCRGERVKVISGDEFFMEAIDIEA
jgi:hydrogenase nickel incorporation protein HypA/HybF